jgi:GDP-L-fucose synthase
MSSYHSAVPGLGNLMPLDARIYVAGHRGLVGSALTRRLEAGGYRNLVTRTHGELDLTNQEEVREFFKAERPEYVFLAAAKVGGIVANDIYRGDFIFQNLMIQSNVIEAAYRNGVKRLLFLGSSCIYPRHCPQPIKEEYLLTGPLEPTNRPYAVAKIAGIEMCSSYNRQYGTQFLSVMPTNLYGPGDNYDPQNSHVIPALIRKCHEAKLGDRSAGRESTVIVWGSGRPRREFLYSDDLADACVFLANLPEPDFQSLLSSHELPPLINVGCGHDQTIEELARLVAESVGFAGTFSYDASRPDGTPQKLLDVTRLTTLGWYSKTKLRDGLANVYEDYLARYVATGGTDARD